MRRSLSWPKQSSIDLINLKAASFDEQVLIFDFIEKIELRLDDKIILMPRAIEILANTSNYLSSALDEINSLNNKRL
jgi:hypothetical protein